MLRLSATRMLQGRSARLCWWCFGQLHSVRQDAILVSRVTPSCEAEPACARLPDLDRCPWHVDGADYSKRWCDQSIAQGGRGRQLLASVRQPMLWCHAGCTRSHEAECNQPSAVTSTCKLCPACQGWCLVRRSAWRMWHACFLCRLFDQLKPICILLDSLHSSQFGCEGKLKPTKEPRQPPRCRTSQRRLSPKDLAAAGPCVRGGDISRGL